ncbi:MAG: phage holin family protein [Verrucomicrobiae bacterium]|nr:phage holin family protein [Verrucomicrobiae bacterium]MCP5520539.1 phage holin family protein [Verrucomicrobiales bacterium]
MADPKENAPGVSATVRRLAARSLGVVSNRFELFILELQEQEQRLFGVLLMALLAAVFSLLALVLASFALVIVFWESARMEVLLGLTAFYALGAGLLGWQVRRRVRDGSPFSATLGELKKDRQWLEGKG